MDKTNLEPRRLSWSMAVKVTIMNMISWDDGMCTPPATFVETGLQMRR